jgi:hypothetical protein
MLSITEQNRNYALVEPLNVNDENTAPSRGVNAPSDKLKNRHMYFSCLDLPIIRTHPPPRNAPNFSPAVTLPGCLWFHAITARINRRSAELSTDLEQGVKGLFVCFHESRRVACLAVRFAYLSLVIQHIYKVAR